MKGYVGKILRVNLSDSSISEENLDIEKAKKFIGARGLGAKIMFEEVDPKVDALSPENKLIIATGPCTGYTMPTGGRYMVMTKSPLTGTLAFANSGGRWGAEFKFTGNDVIIFEGKAEKPVYLYIEDDKVEIRDAGHLWGKRVSETTEILKNETDKNAKVMCIGPAGERLSLISAIMNDVDRAAGRGGVGAVMGSKNLKAVVVRGTKKLEYADTAKSKAVAMEKIKILKDNPVAGNGLPTYGTAVLVNIINENGVLPVKNFQGSYAPKADDISGETLRETSLVRNSACYRCTIGCGRWVKLKDGREVGGPEYETIWAFGSDCDNYDLESINEANELCNEYGLDTISAGATIAAAMELREKGLIKDEEIAGDGLSLDWGDSKAIVEWTRKMGEREGFGYELAKGSYRLCDEHGAPELSMTVKKQELPAYDPRGIQGHGITYAVSNRGACHVKGYMISPEILGQPEKLDRFELKGKPAYAKVFHDLTAVVDSLGLCIFTTFGLGAQDFVDMANACYGEEVFDVNSLMEAGDRIWTLEKLYNLRAGIDKDDDTLPKRLLEDEIADGPSKGWVHKLSELLPEYYEVRGWDRTTSVPTDETLKKLGIEEYSWK